MRKKLKPKSKKIEIKNKNEFITFNHRFFFCCCYFYLRWIFQKKFYRCRLWRNEKLFLLYTLIGSYRWSLLSFWYAHHHHTHISLTCFISPYSLYISAINCWFNSCINKKEVVIHMCKVCTINRVTRFYLIRKICKYLRHFLIIF